MSSRSFFVWRHATPHVRVLPPGTLVPKGWKVRGNFGPAYHISEMSPLYRVERTVHASFRGRTTVQVMLSYSTSSFVLAVHRFRLLVNSLFALQSCGSTCVRLLYKYCCASIPPTRFICSFFVLFPTPRSHVRLHFIFSLPSYPLPLQVAGSTSSPPSVPVRLLSCLCAPHPPTPAWRCRRPSSPLPSWIT